MSGFKLYTIWYTYLSLEFKQFIVIVLGPTWFKRLTIREEDKSTNLTR